MVYTINIKCNCLKVSPTGKIRIVTFWLYLSTVLASQISGVVVGHLYIIDHLFVLRFIFFPPDNYRMKFYHVAYKT